MPNTEPAIDDAAVVREVLDARARRAAVRRARRRVRSPSAAAGEQLAPMAEMAALGVRIFTDDGNGVQDAALMRRALEYAGGLGVIARPALRGSRRSPRGGHMHEGEWSSRLGIPGSPAEAEELMVVARHRAGPAHRRAASTSCTSRPPASVELVRAAKADGPAGHRRGHAAPLHAHRRRVSRGFDPVFKVNPPLRTDADVAAVQAGLADGTIDAIATDHAPHTPGGQGAAVRRGAAGMLGLETALALALTELDLPIDRRCSRCCRGGRPRSPGSATRHGGPIAAGRARQPLRDRPDRRRGSVDPDRAGQPQPQHAVRRPQAARAGSATRSSAGEPVVIDGEAQR